MRRTWIGLAVGLAFAAACTTPPISSTGIDHRSARPPAAAPGGGTGSRAGHRVVGVDLVPLHIPAFIYGAPAADPQIQPGSIRLAQLARKKGLPKHLRVRALPSGEGTVAVDFLELAPPGFRWGWALFPAERALFRAFSRDDGAGDWLVVLTDVQVLKGPDPIPLTAYRWARSDVETYAGCGIPDRAIDLCTTTFYAAAESEIVNVRLFSKGA